MQPSSLRPRQSSLENEKPARSLSTKAKGKRKASHALRIQVPKKTAQCSGTNLNTEKDHSLPAPDSAHPVARSPLSTRYELEPPLNTPRNSLAARPLTPHLTRRSESTRSPMWPYTPALYTPNGHCMRSYDPQTPLDPPLIDSSLEIDELVVFSAGPPWSPHSFAEPLATSTHRTAQVQMPSLRVPHDLLASSSSSRPVPQRSCDADPPTWSCAKFLADYETSTVTNPNTASEMPLLPWQFVTPQQTLQNCNWWKLPGADESTQQTEATAPGQKKHDDTKSASHPSNHQIRSTTSNRAVRHKYQKTAAQLPEFGEKALQILHQAANFHHRPTLRQLLQRRWPTWPLQEQQAVFCSRPWAHFVWLTLQAMAQNELEISALNRRQCDSFFRQAKAYFLAGGGPGLASYLDYENRPERRRYHSLREATLRHPVIIAVAKQWRRQGIEFNDASVAWEAPHDGILSHTANALPQ